MCPSTARAHCASHPNQVGCCAACQRERQAAAREQLAQAQAAKAGK